ncbi:MAG: hypothetical protein OXC19_03525 [Bryobacterales bacterium]|nr:hypothetical protein [Bryobacterales bacterium]
MAQAAALLEAPPLTDTRWDAHLAAVVEHIARLHGHPVPAWVHEPERFLEHVWIIPRDRTMREAAVLYSPAAFIRHSAPSANWNCA